MTKRKAKKPYVADEASTLALQTAPAREPTKLGRLIALLARPDGASLDELTTETGWQAHSVRGALAGSLRRKGFTITSLKIDGRRIYRIDGEARA